jgi:hypothetical protein
MLRITRAACWHKYTRRLLRLTGIIGTNIGVWKADRLSRNDMIADSS